jgi:hypothetical protein
MWAIKRALYRLGFRRRVARKKPPITEANRVARLNWASEHVNWSPEQWAKILWTDETWITGGPHRKQYVTRREGEEWDPTCIVEKHQRKHGWMFWGCFSGATGVSSGKRIGARSMKSPIDNVLYRSSTAGSDFAGRRMVKSSYLMQDGAPGHAAAATRDDLAERCYEPTQI